MNSESFKNHLRTYLPEEEIAALELSLDAKEETMQALILDTEKLSEAALREHFPTLIPHPVVADAFLCRKSELPLGKSLLFELGAFYLLEPCSLLVAHFLQPGPNDFLLDMASAPGGKCIHASFLMRNSGQIIANELSLPRAQILSSNCEKYGRKNICVLSEDARELPLLLGGTRFSKLLLDAPCSGSGMFRKAEKMKEDWTYAKVLSAAKLQKELILAAYSMLLPGGEMIYSTCSYSYEEDEEVVRHLLENSDAELCALPPIEGEYRSDMKEAIHLFPHRFPGEGHFIAKLRKPGALPGEFLPRAKPVKTSLPLPKRWSDVPLFLDKSNCVYAIATPAPLTKVHVLRNGLKIGAFDRKLGMIYDHAFCRVVQCGLREIELTETEAKDYIYGLPISRELAPGYVCLTHEGIPFALGKVAKNQIKNHYPKGLRKKL